MDDDFGALGLHGKSTCGEEGRVLYRDHGAM